MLIDDVIDDSLAIIKDSFLMLRPTLNPSLSHILIPAIDDGGVEENSDMEEAIQESMKVDSSGDDSRSCN